MRPATFAPIYGWFTEGFDTLDLKEAKALLESGIADTVVAARRKTSPFFRSAGGRLWPTATVPNYQTNVWCRGILFAKSPFAPVIKNSAGCRRGFRAKM